MTGREVLRRGNGVVEDVPRTNIVNRVERITKHISGNGAMYECSEFTQKLVMKQHYYSNTDTLNSRMNQTIAATNSTIFFYPLIRFSLIARNYP